MTTKSDDLYGVMCATLDEARLLIERALGMQLKPHESLYFGGDYYRHEVPPSETLILRPNLDGIDGECAELDHPQYPFLLYIEGTHRSDSLNARLSIVAGITLLRRESR